MKIRTFKVRLYPTKEQEKQMFFQAGCARHVYNWCLAFQKSRYEDESIPKKEKFIPAKGLSKYFTAYKKQEGNEWLKDCDAMTLVVAYTDACTAFKNFFKRPEVGYPKFKSRNKTTPAFAPRYDNIKITENTVKITKIGTIKLARKGYIPYMPDDMYPKIKYSNPRITYNGIYWSISVGLEEVQEQPKLSPTALGIDLGIKDLAIVSDGTVYKNINKTAHIKKLEKKLKRMQRQVSRKYEMNRQGNKYNKTNNIIKLEKEILKLQHKITDIRNNYRHTMTHQIVQQKLNKVKQRKQVLLDRLLDNTIDTTTYKNKAGELDEEISKLNNTIKEITNNYNNINNQINQLQQKKKQVAQIKINKTYTKDQIIEAIKNIYVDGNKLEIHININGILFKDTLYI